MGDLYATLDQEKYIIDIDRFFEAGCPTCGLHSHAPDCRCPPPHLTNWYILMVEVTDGITFLTKSAEFDLSN
jgi:hypothetical protein